MKSATPLICDELVDCISAARLPTAAEIHTVAQRIWTDCEGSRSVFASGELPKEVAPSTELRKWFDSDPSCWTEFLRRYRAKLREQSADPNESALLGDV